MNKINTKNTFSNHVLELRKRLLISVITILISGIITFIFHKDILEFLLNPYEIIKTMEGSSIFHFLIDFLFNSY